MSSTTDSRPLLDSHESRSIRSPLPILEKIANHYDLFSKESISPSQLFERLLGV